MKMNKKRLAAALAGLFAAAIFAGCGADKNEAAGEKVFTYGTMSYGAAMENAGTNPHVSYNGWSTLRYGIGETLFRFNEKMEPVPWLAESFEQVDEYTMKIKLRDDVVFSNGKKMTGEAVKACLEDLVAKHDRAPKNLKLKSITADGQTVTLVSSEKMPTLINALADPYACIIDMEAGEKDRIVVGTGPYVAQKVTDTEMELSKNEKYWGAVKPKLDKIIVKSIADGDTLTMAMQSGELDAAQGLPYASLELFQKDSAKYKISQADTSRVYQAAFNYKTPELQDVRVRRAISMALDKENFCKVLLKGNGTPAVGPFPKSMPFGGDAVRAAAYDLEGAKALLKEAGYEDTDGDGYVDQGGKNLELRYLTYPSRQELPILAESLQANLKKIGIKLNVNSTDSYKSFLKSGDYDIFAKALVAAPTGDPEYYFLGNLLKDAVDNSGFYYSPQVEELAAKLHNTYGAEARAALAVAMEQQVLDDCAVLYASHLRMSLVMKPGIEGLKAHPSDYYEVSAELEKKS